jgi:hypothetical protein
MYQHFNQLVVQEITNASNDIKRPLHIGEWIAFDVTYETKKAKDQRIKTITEKRIMNFTLLICCALSTSNNN